MPSFESIEQSGHCVAFGRKNKETPAMRRETGEAGSRDLSSACVLFITGQENKCIIAHHEGISPKAGIGARGRRAAPPPGQPNSSADRGNIHMRRCCNSVAQRLLHQCQCRHHGAHKLHGKRRRDRRRVRERRPLGIRLDTLRHQSKQIRRQGRQPQPLK